MDECDAMASALNHGYRAPVDTILAQGPLARRIVRALDGDSDRKQLAAVYRRLCDCVTRDELFVPGG